MLEAICSVGFEWWLIVMNLHGFLSPLSDNFLLLDFPLQANKVRHLPLSDVSVGILRRTRQKHLMNSKNAPKVLSEGSKMNAIDCGKDKEFLQFQGS